MKMKTNSCDGLYDSLDIRFTKKCDNNCSFCIEGNGIRGLKEVPASVLIKNTIESGIKSVLILGGEPLLYIPKVLEFVKGIRDHVDTIYITTSLPYSIYLFPEEMIEILNIIDGINVSFNHYDSTINNRVFDGSGMHNRFDLLAVLCKTHPSKIRTSINLVKGYIDNKSEIYSAIGTLYYYGSRNIKINELQHSRGYVSFEKELKGFIKLGSPFSTGCQTEINIYKEYWSDLNIILKRSCFLVEKSLFASFGDLLKIIIRSFIKPMNKFKVMYEDGSIKNNWIKES